MTDIEGHRSPSRVELIVLARLSAPTPPTCTDIVKSLTQIGIPLDPAPMRECAQATLVSLQDEGLAASATYTASRKGRAASKNATARFALTDDGRLALRNALGLHVVPTWKQMCARVIPLLALGEEPGEQAAEAALKSLDAMRIMLLLRDRTLRGATSIEQLCDRLVAKQLGIPPSLATPNGIRAFVLAKHCGVESRAEFERIASSFEPTAKPKQPSKPTKSKHATKPNPLKTLVADLAARQLGIAVSTKPKMTTALIRHWVRRQDEADATAGAASWSTFKSAPTASAPSVTAPSAANTEIGDTLLTAVRDAIPMVGSTGRYGKENVFVAALWQQIAHDRRLPQLSLDHFKQWLVAANRHRLVALARADLVDDMDARLVEDSEIEDLGETFHFVVDHRASLTALGQMHYA